MNNNNSNNNIIISQSQQQQHQQQQKIIWGEMSTDDDEDDLYTLIAETIRSMNRNWIDKSIETHPYQRERESERECCVMVQ